MRNPFDHRPQQLRYALAGLAGNRKRLLARQRQNLLHLLVAERQVRRGQVDLVDHGDDLQILTDRQIHVRDGLGLHALRRVDQQDRPFARAERARHFIREIDMSGRVDQIQFVGVAVFMLVMHPDRMGLDGDAPLALQIHPVQQLLLKIARGNGPGQLQQPVGQRGFAVVDMRDDAEVADQFEFCHGFLPKVL